MANDVTTVTVVSYTAFPPLQTYVCGIFLLHYSGSHLHRTLSGILPYEARTFLTCHAAAATIRPTHINISKCHSVNLNTFYSKCKASVINIASPKLKNLYFSSTAVLYAFNIFSLPASAETSIRSVDSGRWKFVIRQSTALNL